MTHRTRILWDDKIKYDLAVETSRIMQNSEKKISPFLAFKQAQVNILPANIRRNLAAIGQIPWLLELMEEYEAGKIQEQPQTRPELPAESNPSPVILEAIHHLKVLAETQAEALLELGIEVRRLRESLEKYETEAPPEPVKKPPITIKKESVKKIIVAGVNTGKQRHEIMHKVKSMSGIDVQFIDTSRKYTEIPKFDLLLVMSWTPHVWQVNAQKSYGDRMRVVRGIKDVVERCSMI